MVYFSELPKARMNILGTDFLANFGEFNNLRKPMLILTVFPGKCVTLSLYLDKRFQYYSHDNSIEPAQDITLEPYSTPV